MAAAFALAGAAVLLAPAVAVRWSGLHAGVGTMDDDVLAASILVAVVGASVSWGRLQYEEHTARRRLHVWIVSLDALVVLALTASLLVLVILHWFPDEHATMADRGYPVVVMWAGVQGVAVVLAELTAHLLFRWLESPARQPASAAV